MAQPPFDLADVDIRRTQGFQATRGYLVERVSETLGLLYDHHWPFRQFATARGVRQSPLHERMAALGACFGEAAGWERPNWFLPADAKRPEARRPSTSTPGSGRTGSPTPPPSTGRSARASASST